MKTKAQLQEEFGWEGPRFFLLTLPEGANPYADASNHIPGHLFIAQANDRIFYACTDSSEPVQSPYATEITE